jgi:hypothetical protein
MQRGRFIFSSCRVDVSFAVLDENSDDGHGAQLTGNVKWADDDMIREKQSKNAEQKMFRS